MTLDAWLYIAREDMLLSSLVEVLEEKGVLTQDEWEKDQKQKLKKADGIMHTISEP